MATLDTTKVQVPQPRIAGRFASVPVEERFWSKVDKNGSIPEYAPHLGPCWLWTAGCFWNGYGIFWDGERTTVAHRWVYEQRYGPVPVGLECDHLCRVRHCVNYDHLELVTQRVNIERGEAGIKNRSKTHCPHGHLYDKANTYVCSQAYRHCRECKRIRDHERRRS